MLAAWKGLLAHGLAVGDLDEDTVTIRLDWVAAPWLLTPPDDVVMWARNYQRAYPGALDDLDIPASAYATSDTWREWIQD